MKLFILFLLLSQVCFAQKEILKIGFVPFAPYMNFKDGKYSGSVVKEIENLYSNDYYIKWVHLRFHQLNYFLNEDKIDFFPMMIKTQEREKVFKFSKRPILNSHPAICTTQPNFFNPKDKKFKLGVLKNAYLPEELRNKYIIIENKLEDNFLKMGFKMLLQNKFDGIFVLDNNLIKGKRVPANMTCRTTNKSLPTHFIMKKESTKDFTPTRTLP